MLYVVPEAERLAAPGKGASKHTPVKSPEKEGVEDQTRSLATTAPAEASSVISPVSVVWK
jgi:hypothetical protein